MNISQQRASCALILASAAVAAALTFGDRLVSMPVGSAVAEISGEATSACHGQAWPNYSAACLEEISGTKPDRVLGVSRAVN